MSDAMSVLDGAVAAGSVRVRDQGLCGMVTLRGDLGDATLGQALRESVGTAVPEQRRIVMGTNGQVAWMSSDELLVLCAYDSAPVLAADLTARLSGTHALVANVSDARAVFEIEGAGTREVLAKLAPVDMRPSVFDPGMIRRTRLAQVAAAIWLEDERRAHVICFRSTAHYVFDLLRVAARDGAAVGHF